MSDGAASPRAAGPDARLAERAAALAGDPAVTVRGAPSAAPWPLDDPEPADLAAFYAVTDGIELADGTRVVARAELATTTAWLLEEKALTWPSGVIVLGERAGVVIARDLDPDGTRAGGGVLEAPTDGLESFTRVALDLVGYLEARAGHVDPRPAPEVAARDALARKDAAALAAALERPFYPGAERELARARVALDGLRPAAGRPEEMSRPGKPSR